MRPAWAANISPLCSFLLFYLERRNLKEGGVLLGLNLRGERPSWRGKNRSRKGRQLATLSSRRREDKTWNRAVCPSSGLRPTHATKVDGSSIKAPPPKDSTIVQNGASSWGAHVQTQKLMGIHFIFTQPLCLRKSKANQTSDPFVLEPESLHVFQSPKRCPHG